MAAGDGIFQYQHITASTVVVGQGAAGSQGVDNYQKQAVLHTVTINTAAAAATVQIFDYNSTAAPPASAAITGVVTAPAGGYTTPVTLIFDCQVKVGITVIVAGTADLTVTYR